LASKLYYGADYGIFRYGRKLLKKYKSFKNAEREISELILCLDDHWIKFEFRVDFLRRIWPSLDERLQVHQNALLHTLQSKLQEANQLLDGTIGGTDNESFWNSPSIGDIVRKKGYFRKGQYAVSLKDCLEKSVKDLERWHAMFDPSWFLLIRVNNLYIDEQLNAQQSYTSTATSTLKSLRDTINASQSDLATQGSIWLANNSLSDNRTPIPFSTVHVCQDRRGTESLLVDTVVLHPQSELSSTTREIRDLGRVLSKSDPATFGLLRCRGVIKVPDSEQDITKFEFVFSLPDGLTNPTSLRALLLAGGDAYSINERLALARSLANSVMYVHSSNFVHKNIRPETIVVLHGQESGFGASFLVGFEKFRAVDGQTLRIGDCLWEKDLYRHPTRQGLQPEERYKMQHDIYSLGVSLLEVGLWTSFVLPTEEPDTYLPGIRLDIEAALAEKLQRKRAAEIKRVLIETATKNLPKKMGWKYTDIVLSCLTCLDKTDNGFGAEDQFMDEDGILVAVRYIEIVR
jgi:hypothetical protein